ncbi:5-dehydro-4-deoxyglucarate dehydratase [Georgenia sp. SYP-B2076]|uniref:5-dehydro-4-deoxyglucarate dehydratase n=1 Tax=Georgenia sp. SYP-B2076 TaxID=2495881 RepID=UPI000F8C3043|nr:5-dehydro-4-deoxyglucarate dehydratase [Georgenia sp. SYP-B2076]
MTSYTPDELKLTMGSGLLSFPVTHTTPDHAFDRPAYQEHVSWLAGHGPSALFAAGGTGEFFCLTPAEVGEVVRAAVEAAPAGVPIIAPAGYGTAQARAMVRDGDAAGADGIFLCPPYLTELDQAGLVEHVRAVCAETDLGVVVYHRANAQFSAAAVEELAATVPNFVGFKDGIGDVDLMTRLYANLGDRLLYVGGLPTAETYALPYLEMGVTTYSSAIFNFAPVWAQRFYRAVLARDVDTVYAGLRDFVLPYLDIRNHRAGYAVSIVKAGLTAVGRPAGPVRLPLTDLEPAELAELSALIEKAMSPQVLSEGVSA